MVDQVHRLTDVINLIGGGTPKRSISEYWNGDIPWLSVKDFNHGGRYVEESDETITQLGLEKSSTKLLKPGMLIISARGTVGELAQLKSEMAFNQSCYGIDAKTHYLDNDYLYYLLKLKIRELKSIAHGSVFDTITRDTFENIEVEIPSKNAQKAIAHILGTLDDKIELNQKMNQTLEEIAKTIFKSWFVNFDPVRAKAEGRPTGLPPVISDLFPDELVDSEIGEIPKGWGVGSISDFTFLNKKTVNPSQSAEVYEHFSIPAFDSGQFPVLDLGTDIKSNKNLVVEGSLLVSKLNPNTPRVWLPTPKDLHEQICSTEFMVYTPTDHSNIAFLWGLFTSSVVSERMEAMVTGTSKSHQRVKPNDVSNITTVTPDARLIETYGDIVLPMLNRTLVGKSESSVVVELRDTLLPKLISGELRIPDAEKFLEEAGV